MEQLQNNFNNIQSINPVEAVEYHIIKMARFNMPFCNKLKEYPFTITCYKVLSFIMFHADKQHTLVISYKELSERIHINYKTVQNSMKCLEGLGVINIKRGAKNVSTHITINREFVDICISDFIKYGNN